MTIPNNVHPEHILPETFTSQDLCPPTYSQLSDLRIGVAFNSLKRNEVDPSTPLPSSKRRRIHVSDGSASEACTASSCDLQALFGDDCSSSCDPEDVCIDCIVDCQDEDCQASPEGQCTDECLVETCEGNMQCREVCREEECNVEQCQMGDMCLRLMDPKFQLECCDAYQKAMTGESPVPISPGWNNALDNLLPMPPQRQPEQPRVEEPDYLAGITDTSNWDGASHTTSSHSEPLQTTIVPEPSASSNFVCQWQNCNTIFSDMNELAAHVHNVHLHALSFQSSDCRRPQAVQSPCFSFADALCQWNGCQDFDLSSVPGPSLTATANAPVDLLTNHLFQDHLGLSYAHQLLLQTTSEPTGTTNVPLPAPVGGFFSEFEVSLPPSNSTDLAPQRAYEGGSSPASVAAAAASPPSATHNKHTVAVPPPIQHQKTYATPAPTPSPHESPSTSAQEPTPPHNCSDCVHQCKWKSCLASFNTCAELTEHLTTQHVGSGKSMYECFWDGCDRFGERGFSSKQKVMRHLQAHTGHRPFTCEQCGQHFSEAATLQQHIRRHTQEKPFVCDFPGCNKAFAITGALTIHKRTHNGERPFQCHHCGRAFAESSNLSKHMRTHTGKKPYVCQEPGCGKAFARPDQLTRHSNVHTRKKTVI